MGTIRTIKFRGKAMHTGEWVVGDYHRRAGGEHFIIVMEPNNEGKCSYHLYQVHPVTVSQYTGITDSEGNEVYEGDVCLLKDTAVQGTIDYIDGGFTFKSFGGLRWGWDYCLRNGLTVLHSLYDNKIGND